MKKIKEYSPFSIIDMLQLLSDHYPIENNVILKDVCNDNKQLFHITMNELVDLGFIENGTSVNYHWLTDKGRKYLEEYG